MLQLSLDLSCEHVDLGNPVDLISEKFHPHSGIGFIGRNNLHHISAHPEGTSFKIHLVPVILDVDELPDDLVPVLLHTRTQGYHHFLKILRLTQAIDTGHTGDDNHVPPLNEGRRRRQAQLINLVIDRRIFGNIGIAGGHISLWLVIIIIGNKIFHCILRKEFLHFPVKLCGQRFIMGNDQRRLIKLLNHIGHGKGLAGSGNTKKCLELVAFFKTFHQLFDCLGLVSGWLIFRY